MRSLVTHPIFFPWHNAGPILRAGPMLRRGSKILRDIGFAGFLTFEQDGVPDMKAAMRRGKEILEGLLAKSA